MGWRADPPAPKYGPTTAEKITKATYPYGQFMAWTPNSEK
jgi:hypothetical protein